jgi:fibronectin-binding autotransporter adhesin
MGGVVFHCPFAILGLSCLKQEEACCWLKAARYQRGRFPPAVNHRKKSVSQGDTVVFNRSTLAVFAALSVLGPFPFARADITPIGDVSPSNPFNWNGSTTGYIGNTASGTLTVNGGSGLLSNEGWIGCGPVSTGAVTVEGTGSTWTADGVLCVGGSGSGTLMVSNGGSVNSGAFIGNGRGGVIGVSAGSRGMAVVSGAGSTWNCRGPLSVGFYGHGTLSITDGGSVSTTAWSGSSDGAMIAEEIGSTGVVLVDGAGSAWATDQSFFVGYEGNGTLSVVNGGNVSSTGGYLGMNAATTGVVVVKGSGSLWACNGNGGVMSVGYSGAGTLSITDGGRVTSDLGFLGNASGSSGVVTVDGPGSTWTNTGDLCVGVRRGSFSSTNGTLTISNGGAVSARTTYLPTIPNSPGMIHFGSGGGTLATDNFIGSAADLTGSGTINVKNLVTDMEVTFDSTHGLKQTFALNGGSITVNLNMTGAADGPFGLNNGRLQVKDGCRLTSLDSYVGRWPGSSGTATVDGAGSTWATDNFYVGCSGGGVLNVVNSGTVSSANSYVGYDSGSVGVATLSGAGSTWTIADTLFVGNTGSGTVTQTDGTGVIARLVLLGTAAGVTGTYNLDGGALVLQGLSKGGGTGVFNFGGGTLRSAGASFSSSVPMTLTGIGGNATFDSPSYTCTLSGRLSGPGGLNKVGGGTLTLSAANTFSGDTIIAGGTLLLTNTNALQGSTLDYGNYGGTLRFNSLTTATLGGLKGSQDLFAPVTLSIGGNGQSTVYSGRLSGPGSLKKLGTGVLVLSGANTYSGSTTVSAGTLVLQGQNALQYSTFTGGTGSLVFDSTVSGHAFTFGGLSGSSNLDLRDNAANAVALSVGTNGANTTYSGALNGTGSLTKLGAGVLTLSAANAYTGPTNVSDGVLSLIGSLNSSSALTVGGGTFSYTPVANGGTGNSQTTAGLTVNLGASTVKASSGNTLSLGSIVRNADGVVCFNSNMSGTITATHSNTNGILGPWAIYGSGASTNYATASGSTIVPYSGATAVTSGVMGLTDTTGTVNYSLSGGGGTLTAAVSANTIQFAGATSRITASPANLISLNGLMNVGSGTATITGGYLVIGDTHELVFTGPGNITVESVIQNNESGDSTLIMAGSGALVLSGANTYGGETYALNGTLCINSPSALGTGQLMIDGGAIDNVSSVAISLANNPHAWNRDFTFVGTQSLNLGTGLVTLGGDRTVTVNANTLTVGGTIRGDYSLTKAGAGTLTLAGANTYNGGTTLGAGSLNINNSQALGSSMFTIAGTSTIDNTTADPVTLSSNNPQVWNANFTFVGTQDLNLGNGPVTLGGNRTVTVNAKTLTVGGVIDGSYSLTKAGAGTLVLSGANTYSGATTVNAGSLVLQNENALLRSIFSGGAGTLAFDSTISSHAFAFGGLSGSSNLELRDNDLNPVALKVGYYGVPVSYSGSLSGSGSLTKIGASGLTLSGVNSYTGGTTIVAGTLTLSASGSIDTSQFIDVMSGSVFRVSAKTGGFVLRSSQALEGSGCVLGTVLTSPGSHIDPGDGIGTLTIRGYLNLSDGTLLDYELGSVSNSDVISMAGSTLYLDGQDFSDFNFTALGGFSVGTYTLIDAKAVSGSLGTSNLSGPIGSGYNGTLAIVGDDLVLTTTAVPEPASLVLLAAGLLALLPLAWQRRKHRA